METTAIETIAKLPHKCPIQRITGTITGVFDYKTGASEHGEWSFQDAVLEGDDGDKVRLKLQTRDELDKSSVGTKVAIEGWENDKGEWKGMWVVKEEYNGETYTKVAVTKVATIKASNGGSVEEVPKAETDETAGRDYKGALKEIAKSANLYVNCFKAAKYALKQLEATDDEKTYQVATTLFIEANRKSLAKYMPVGSGKPSDAPKPAPAPAPAPKPSEDAEDDIIF